MNGGVRRPGSLRPAACMGAIVISTLCRFAFASPGDLDLPTGGSAIGPRSALTATIMDNDRTESPPPPPTEPPGNNSSSSGGGGGFSGPSVLPLLILGIARFRRRGFRLLPSTTG